MSRMNRESNYWNKRADKYAQRPIADQATYEEKLEKTREYFRPDMNVLEIGCGTGSTAIAHAPFVKHILATDFSERMVEIGRDKARAAGVTNVTFAVTPASGLDAPDGSFDAVMAHNLLHLLDDRKRVIADVHRLLKPGGIFVSSTACIGDMALPIRMIVPVGRFLRLFPLVKVFCAEDLKGELEDAGFDIDYAWQPKRNAAAFLICRKK